MVSNDIVLLNVSLGLGMRFLLVLILIKILELSRFNLTNYQIPRSFYDLLSGILLLAFLGYMFAFKHTDQIELKLESAFQEAIRGWIKVVDVIFLILVGFLLYKTAGILYAHPIRCATGDMLPIVRGAGEYLLSGENPFTKTYCPSGLNYMYAPMMLVYYLPAILAKIDVRFISLLCFTGICVLSYTFYRRRGRPLTGFLISLVLITSGLFPFLLMSVHTFPYLLVLSCFMIAASKENDGMLFFLLALAMTSRRTFWLFIPLLLIYFVKERKIKLPNLGYFALGALLGLSPLLLFSNTYIQSFFKNLSRQSQSFFAEKGSNPVVHSLGLSHYLSGYRLETAVLFLLIFSLLFILAIKFINKKNLWIFFSLALLSLTFIQVQTRAQEYYFMPLLMIILFAPMHIPDLPVRKKHLNYLMSAAVLLAACLSIGYPFISGNKLIVEPIRGHKRVNTSGFIISRGFLEVSLGTSYKYLQNKGLTLIIRRNDYHENQPVQVEISINGKLCFSENIQTRILRLKLGNEAFGKYIYMGGNDLEIELLPHETFAAKIE